MNPTIFLIRPGNEMWATHPLARQLTEKGFQQASDRKEALEKMLNGELFDIVFSSPATRALHTALKISGFEEKDIIVLDALYMPEDSTDRQAVETMFAELMYSPLRLYRKADEAGALIRYGEKAASLIRAEIQTEKAQNILVVGHAVLLNTIASALVGNDTDLILRVMLAECEGLCIHPNGWVEPLQ